MDEFTTLGGVDYAHSLAGRPPTAWEPLWEHLEKVAALAAEFAGAFGATEWGRLAGLWHDLGKYSTEFQSYLRRSEGAEAHFAGPRSLATSYWRGRGCR